MTTELAAALRLLEDLEGRSLLCAVSGGLDSMCLLHVVSSWGRERGIGVTAAHFNHQLRGQAADRDEAFVRGICADWNIPFVSGRGDTRALAEAEGLSVEEAARTLRYRFLRQEAQKRGAEILTAHHADDNAETMLLNLVRGTGLRGLTGIPPSRDGVTRIFLGLTRGELAAYAEEHHIPHVEDETNLDPDAAARNLLRWKVLPLLRELNPKAVAHMNAAAEQLRAVDAMLEQQAQALAARLCQRENRVELERSLLAEAPTPVQAGVLLKAFDLLGAGRKDVGRVHLEALEALALRESGQLDLPHGVTAWVRGSRLILSREEARPKGRTPLSEETPLHWNGWRVTLLNQPEGEGLSLSAEEDAVLEIGPCPPGERLTLPGSRGPRTVKRLCVDRHIAPPERDGLPSVFVDHHLAAVWRLGVDRIYLPEGKPRRFIQILRDTEENQYEK